MTFSHPDYSHDFYVKNLELYTKIHPISGVKLDIIPMQKEIEVCTTANGELNLRKKKYGIIDYYHSPEGVMNEAQEMISEEIENEGEALYVYGLGLGYLYDTLESWLKKNPKRMVIFLENDLEVIYHFLHTARATKFLQDPQAVLFQFEDYQINYEHFLFLQAAMLDMKINFLALPLYGLRHQHIAYQLCYNILYDSAMVAQMLKEFLSGQGGYLKNFYRNIFYLPSSYLASELFQQFKGMPAIICGAGPSIQKNIHLLKELSHKAVIFAGGSSLNVLNHAGIIPHFGLGVDPNKEQNHRLLTNHTFHLPYLYRQRVSHDAFKLMQGPKVFVPGSAIDIARLFEERFNISIPLLDEGHNVINLCSEVAYRMGFNPIIYIGMDLAFTEIQPYAAGINTHPLWIEKSRPYETGRQQTVRRKDLEGKWVNTKWDWIGEANWLSHFAISHPDVKFINATEGGIGFSPVPNVPLADVANIFMKKSYDIEGKVHAEIQNHPIKIHQPDLILLLSGIKSSLDKCLTLYNEILDEKSKQIKETPETDPVFHTSSTILRETEIENELAYHYFLSMIDKVYSFMQKAHRQFKKVSVKPFYAYFVKIEFIKSAINQHIQLLKEAFQLQFHTAQPLQSEPKEIKILPVEGEVYQFQEGNLQITDPELDIHIHIVKPFEKVVREVNFYPNQQIMNETFFWEDQLHGPSRFYSPSGQLLSESWFCEGRQEGKSLQYYASGKLYGIRHFKNGLLHGKQEYYYETGIVSVLMYYHEGFLDGTVRTYTPEGSPLRELYYLQGQRHGDERMWNQNGRLVMECRYDHGIPVGKAKEWTPTGWLFKDVDIHQYPNDFDVKIYTKEGKVLQSFKNGLEDYTGMYAETQKRVEVMEESINEILSQIDPYIEENIDKIAISHPEVYQEFVNLKKAIEGMEEIKKTLSETFKANEEKAEEYRRKKQGLE